MPDAYWEVVRADDPVREIQLKKALFLPAGTCIYSGNPPWKPAMVLEGSACEGGQGDANAAAGCAMVNIVVMGGIVWQKAKNPHEKHQREHRLQSLDGKPGLNEVHLQDLHLPHLHVNLHQPPGAAPPSLLNEKKLRYPHGN